MDIKAIEKAALRIQNKLFKKTSTNALGAFKSQFRGSGLQFREHQVYTPGDDVRFIDWKLSARLQKTYIKTFEEERNVEIVVCIDLTSSSHMGHKKISKYQAALEIACLLAYLAQKTKDLVKVVLLIEPEIQTPFLAGRELITYLTVQLDRMGHLSKDKSIGREFEMNPMDIDKKIKVMMSYAQRKKEVVFLSDFYDLSSDHIKKLSSQRHLHLFRLVTPFDYATKMPFSFWGKESGGTGKKFYPRISLAHPEMEAKKLGRQKIHSIDLSKGHLDQIIKEMA
ncbi:MAG: DUF58 domain-containing protein [Bacteriovoracaceae bacterium]|nr:DUF58 domain-containing protein [Bacteriovoracaceae bacterium]